MKKGAEPEGGLTTADTEEKCDVEEGVTRDEDLIV
jgi:hypothetical protein